MWTVEQRQAHDRAGLRYPSDLTAEEWALVEPFIPPAKRGGRKRTVDVREVLNGFSLGVANTGDEAKMAAAWLLIQWLTSEERIRPAGAALRVDG